VTQSSSPFYARRTYWSIAATLNAAGLHTFSYQLTVPSFGIWGFHLASGKDIHPDDFNITVPTKYLTEQTLAAAAVFAKDIAPIEVPINTMMEPKLYTLYVADLRR
jgi:spermidine synthase